MVYNQKLIAVVKCEGRILREHKHPHDGGPCVRLPFGSEYTVLLKNQEARRAIVKITIDSQDVLGGDELVLNPDEELELKGFLSKGKATHSFKFIQKTEKIVEHRGDKIDDGMIVIKFTFEKCKPEPIFYVPSRIVEEHHHHHHHHPWVQTWPQSYPHSGPFYGSSSGIGDQVLGGQMNCCADMSNVSFSAQAQSSVLTKSASNQNVMRASSYIPPDLNVDEGITVKGSEVDQRFQNTKVGPLESNWNSIVLRIIGQTENGKPISKPLKVRDKVTCDTCGTKNKSNNKFCSECGTSLI